MTAAAATYSHAHVRGLQRFGLVSPAALKLRVCRGWSLLIERIPDSDRELRLVIVEGRWIPLVWGTRTEHVLTVLPWPLRVSCMRTDRGRSAIRQMVRDGVLERRQIR